jgi:hypothetical protein
MPAKSPIRALLDLPAARLFCRDHWLTGQWEFALPISTIVPLRICGKGARVPAWEQLLGLQNPQFKDKMVYSQLQISVPIQHAAKFDRDITGDYDLLDRCGTASNSLHRQQTVPGRSDSNPPVFLLLDPSRTSHWDDDCFAFSISNRRYEFGETRPVIARLDKKWRQSSVSDTPSNIDCTIPCQWKTASEVTLKVSLIT